MSFHKLPDETRIKVMSYLRAADILNTVISGKTVNKFVVKEVIKQLFEEKYHLVIPIRDKFEYSPENLYIAEMKLMLMCLTSPQPSGQGYWISSTWVSNSKKYYEAIPLPEYNKKSSGKKSKLQKIRIRRGSDCLPPWPCMNADITCEHGNLMQSKGTRARRRAIDRTYWKFLRQIYPAGAEFRISSCTDCAICSEIEATAKITQNKRLSDEKRIRQNDVNGPLLALSSRKSGLPFDCLVPRNVDGNEGMAAMTANTTSFQPLRPGIYHIVPRSWLKIWRQYLKDPSVESLPILDCTGLLCAAHGLLVVPPHVQEYLAGTRRGLLQGLGDYNGAVYEILTSDEWDYLQSVSYTYGLTDFTVRFSCDGEKAQWSLDICTCCDPFDRGEVSLRTRLRNNGRNFC